LETYNGNAVFDGNDLKKEPEKKMLDHAQDFTDAVSLNTNSDIIYANSTGICVERKGTNIWQTIVDGSLGTMYDPDVFPCNILEDSKENYYILYSDSSASGHRLIKYYYDPDINTTPAQELSIYTLNSSNTLRKCISEFQKKNPDIKIDLNVAIPLEEEDAEPSQQIPKHDYIQNLNTELLAGQGCDIINVCELPYESYVQKGASLDLTASIEPVRDQLLTNIIDACTLDGKLYAIPVRYNVPMIYAPSEDVSKLGTIEDLVSYAKTHTDSSFLGNFTFPIFIDHFLPFGINKMIPEHKSVDTVQISNYLLSLKAIADQTGIVEYLDNNAVFHFASNLPETGGLAMESVNGMRLFTLNSTYTDYCHYGYTTLERSFSPSIELAVNSSSKQADLAKEFILFCLNEPIQECDLEDGLPVQTEALEKTTFKPAWSTAYIYDKDGNLTEVPLVKITGDLRTEFLNKIKSLNQLAVSDDALETIMNAHLPDYLNGKKTLEETVTAIQNKLNLYIQE